MANLRYSESAVVARSPEALYDMVSDVTRMGEWSPVCKIANRTEAARRGIPVTLAALKEAAEAG